MSEETTTPAQIDDLSFKEGLDELATIVRSLESNQVELEQSIQSLMGELEPESDDSIDTTLS